MWRDNHEHPQTAASARWTRDGRAIEYGTSHPRTLGFGPAHRAPLALTTAGEVPAPSIAPTHRSPTAPDLRAHTTAGNPRAATTTGSRPNTRPPAGLRRVTRPPPR
jgi:hypothetical protein